MQVLLLLLTPWILPAASSQPTPPEATPPAIGADTYEELLAEYAVDLAEHEEVVASTRGLDARERLAKKHPVRKYWRKFRSAARKDGRALLWMLANAEVYEPEYKKIAKEKERLYDQLFEDHLDAEWFDEVLRHLKDDAGLFGEAVLEERYTLAAEESSSDETRAHALYRLGWLYRGSRDSERESRADAILERCAREFPGTRYGTSALANVITSSELEPGKPAPDFHAETIEGHEFKLSDYAGKVVLLDFYGFW